MRTFTHWLLALALLSPAVGRAEKLVETKDALKKLLAGTAKQAKLKVAPTPEEAKRLKDTWDVSDGETTFYLGKNESGGNDRIVVVLQESGKEGPIIAAIGMDGMGKVLDVVLTEFGEERGAPAKEPAFLSQFKGKDGLSKLKLGDDLDGVAGATWTSKAMTTLVRRAVALAKVLVVDRAGAAK